MKKQLKSAEAIRGTVSAEAAIGSAAMILLFAVFISIAGYCITAARVKSMAEEKAMISSVAMYATDIELPISFYSENPGKSGPPLAKGLLFICITSDENIEVIANYKYISFLGEIKTKVSSICTLWNGDEKALASDQCVWELPPAERGRKIEEIFGGNLPEFFPVIDYFDYVSGEADCIISIDTSLEVYETGTEISNVINEKAERLSNFTSGISGGVEIRPNEIITKKLVIVIPENELSDKQDDNLESAVFNAAARGIDVEVKRFQYAGK